jgi:hypothetical protein
MDCGDWEKRDEGMRDRRENIPTSMEVKNRFGML